MWVTVEHSGEGCGSRPRIRGRGAGHGRAFVGGGAGHGRAFEKGVRVTAALVGDLRAFGEGGAGHGRAFGGGVAGHGHARQRYDKMHNSSLNLIENESLRHRFK